MKIITITLVLIFSIISFNVVAIDGDYESRYCEFYVNNFYLEKTSHYGIPNEKMVSTIIVANRQEGKLLKVGMWVSYLDLSDNKVKEENVFADFDRTIEFIFRESDANRGSRDYMVRDFAYFVDVERPNGNVVRLWMSNRGNNFNFVDTFSYPHNINNIPYGTRKYPNLAADIFNVLRSCK